MAMAIERKGITATLFFCITRSDRHWFLKLTKGSNKPSQTDQKPPFRSGFSAPTGGVTYLGKNGVIELEQNVETWPPCQAFYIESMLSITSSAIDSTEKLSTIFDPNEDLSELQHEEILDWIQNIATQAAALSRYFWAVKKKERIHKQRSRYLRRIFGISEGSAIRNRDLRNLIEHFDENLDIFVSKPVVGIILPNYVGVEPDTKGVPMHVFRAYYNRIGVFEVLGHRFEIQPLVDEIYEIHRKLVSFSESGYMFRNAV